MQKGIFSRREKGREKGKVGDKSPKEPKGAKVEKYHLSSNRDRYNGDKAFRISFDIFLIL